NDAADAFGDGERQRRLAARGRACDKHRGFAAQAICHVVCPQIPGPELYPIAHRRCLTSRIPMTHVATLIAHPSAHLPDGIQQVAAERLPNASAPAWLDPGLALDVPFTPPNGTDDRTTADALRAALGDTPIDVVVQQAAGRRKRLLLADMDSTMI